MTEDNNKKEYRELLISTLQKTEDSYDKAVLTLSGGALGISFAFVKNIIGTEQIFYPNFLFYSWLCWGFSVTFALFSFFFSILSLKKAIQQLDLGKIYNERPGSYWSVITSLLNIFGGLLFLIGVIFISVFALKNLR